MIVLGIESSCDDFAAAVLDDKTILSNVVASQLEAHLPFQGVAPEVAGRLHAELALPTVKQALKSANIEPNRLDGVAFTNRPGLVGSLLVGACFGKTFAWALGKPFVGVDHVTAHMHAIRLIEEIEYPYLSMVASGGHTVLSVVNSFHEIEVIGSTIDDALGESFDKVAKFYDIGYPGGPAVEALAKTGDENAFAFPFANLHKSATHRYDLSYSGLKNAVINQKAQFHNPGKPSGTADIAASFQKAAIGILVSKIKKALKDFNLTRVAIGGGVAANGYLRQKLTTLHGITLYAPPLSLCGDNGAMIAFLGGRLLTAGAGDPLNLSVSSRVLSFKRGLKINEK